MKPLRTLPPGNIAIPCTGQMWTKAAQSLVFLSHHLPANSTMSFLDSLSTIAGKRNAAVAYFLEANHLKWLCFIDSDMVVPPDTITKLLRTRGDVVGGVFCQREPPYPFEFGWVDGLSDDPRRPTDTDDLQFRSFNLELSGQPVSVDVIGTGLLLIHRHVFTKLEPPWFEPNERLIKGYGQNEDWNFCIRAKRAGFDVVCATDVFADHLGGVQPLSLDFVRTWQATHLSDMIDRVEVSV